MYFLNPTYLWALLGLIVPIAIHLWSKKEGKTIKIGSIQLLKTVDTKQSSSIKLNEFWLLLLRLLLIGILVLILSNVHFKKKVDYAPLSYIVEASLLQNKKIKSILDTISKDVPISLLQPGFPEIDLDKNYTLDTTIPNYWQLAKEMQALKSDSIIVFTSAYQSGFKGIRPEINKPIEWIPISTDETNKHLLEVNPLDEELELLVMSTSDTQVKFDKEILLYNNAKWNTSKDSIFYLNNWAAINTKKTSPILLFYDADYLSEAKYFEAGFKVISKYLKHKIDLVKTNKTEQIDAKKFDIIIWLSKKPLIETNGKVVLYQLNPFAKQLIEESSTQGMYHLTKLLNVENIENDHLPEQLIKLLDINPTSNKKINQHDSRVLEKTAFIPVDSSNKIKQSKIESLSITKWLWALFLLVLILERIVSFYRTQ